MKPLILEQFTSYQGTGHLLGVRQHFVRFAGCSLKGCPIRNYCDEPRALGTQRGIRRSPRSIVEPALEEVGEGGWLHITGGEPTDQMDELSDLCRVAHANGLRIHIQTAGIRAIEFPFDWLTVSPKTSAHKLRQRYGHELVMVYNGQALEDLQEFESLRFWYHYLVPLDERGASSVMPKAQLLDELAELRAAHGRHHNAGPWMLTVQAHKLWGMA
jgi:organic radical activating enzyme